MNSISEHQINNVKYIKIRPILLLHIDQNPPFGHVFVAVNLKTKQIHSKIYSNMGNNDQQYWVDFIAVF
jgi:hypothetical protein